jgi:hypothetical protein
MAKITAIMKKTVFTVLVAILTLTFAENVATAQDKAFQRIADFPIILNHADADEAVAEIIDVTEDGNILIYTDSKNGAIGFIDITDPTSPKAAGNISLKGEPTSVAVSGKYALVAVNTSKSYSNPSGFLAVMDLANRKTVRTINIQGQPDSVTISPDKKYAAVAIENERDEEVNDGKIPQMPPGFLVVLDIVGDPSNWKATKVDLTGLADICPSDPEPEFVDINRHNIAVVSLQENNHIIMVDLESAKVSKHFDAGKVDLDHIDIKENKIIETNGALLGIPREPDGVAWTSLNGIVTTNEGDYNGGSRGFSVFSQNGDVLFDSGNSLEHLAIQVGHYPENRAEKKGIEPEGAEVGIFDGIEHIFIGSERGNFVAVYRYTSDDLEFLQALPTAVSPEGLLAIPKRNLFVVTSEEDDAEQGGVTATIYIYQLRNGKPSYPTIQSALVSKGNGTVVPIGWAALSGLAPSLHDANILYTVPDNAIAESRIYTVNVSKTPALITEELVLKKNGSPVVYDLEGIATLVDGGFWLASEGNPEKDSPNMIVKVDANGTVLKEIKLPDSVRKGAVKWGFEGITVSKRDDKEKIYVAFQRPWKNDPENYARIGEYDPSSGEWRFFYYPLNKQGSEASGWIGLSELVYLGNHSFAVIERDKGWGRDARLKAIYMFSIAGLTPKRDEEGNFPVLEKKLAYDLLPDLQALNGLTLEKVEGLTVALDGKVYVITDNDALDDAPGETQFLCLGDRKEIFGF